MSRGVTAADALQRLREGNARFAANVRGPGSLLSAERRAALAIAQEPFAIVLGCSDSRVPVEIVFDQGPGDLFVIRVAGNVVAPSLIGSVEFAADRFGTRLVVVLGHSSCGAIAATLEQLHRPTASHSPNLKDIVDRIRPAVDGLEDEREAMRANILASVHQLRHGSAIIEGLVGSNGLLIVGAWYELETGLVRFLEETLPG
ncbi:MAG TPA: carbonic anhydrase [Steroidobacteraceae bacterium]|nr:carbonic anhydrase [Steroidobacteraceae bacterium]